MSIKSIPPKQTPLSVQAPHVCSLIVFAFCLALWLSPCNAAADQTTTQIQSSSRTSLRVGYFQFPPHVYSLPDKEVTGAAIELLRDHIAPAMGIEIQFVGPFPLPRLLNDFAQRNLDAILVLSRTAERESVFTYPPTPFWQMQPGLVLQAASALASLEPPDQLNGMRIAYVRGAWLPDFFKKTNAHFEFNTGEAATDLNMHKLANGRVDAVLGPDKCALNCSILHNGMNGQVKIIDLPGETSPIYTVFAKNMAPEIIARYDAALRATLSSVSYKEIKQRYIQDYAKQCPYGAVPDPDHCEQK